MRGRRSRRGDVEGLLEALVHDACVGGLPSILRALAIEHPPGLRREMTKLACGLRKMEPTRVNANRFAWIGVRSLRCESLRRAAFLKWTAERYTLVY